MGLQSVFPYFLGQCDKRAFAAAFPENTLPPKGPQCFLKSQKARSTNQSTCVWSEPPHPGPIICSDSGKRKRAAFCWLKAHPPAKGTNRGSGFRICQFRSDFFGTKRRASSLLTCSWPSVSCSFAPCLTVSIFFLGYHLFNRFKGQPKSSSIILGSSPIVSQARVFLDCPQILRTKSLQMMSKTRTTTCCGSAGSPPRMCFRPPAPVNFPRQGWGGLL